MRVSSFSSATGQFSHTDFGWNAKRKPTTHAVDDIFSLEITKPN